MKLFISYARVDRPFCDQIVRTLETAHDVWFDRRLHAGKKWWEQILHRLDECEGFVYLLSPESVESEYCQKEYAVARDSGKLIFPLKIQSNTQVPEELLETQMVDFSDGLIPEAVALLMAGINVAEVERALHMVRPTQVPIDAPIIDPPDASAVFTDALDAYNAGRLDNALFKLMQVRESGYDPGPFVSLDDMIEDVQAALDRQAYLREAERSYLPIAHMIAVPALREQGCASFARFRQAFPDYDPQGIAEQCAQPVPPPRLNVPRSVVIGAVITGLLGVVVAAVAINSFLLGDDETPPTLTYIALSGSTSEQPPDTSTLAIDERARQLAEAGVSRNADWTPYAEEINSVEMALVPAGCFQMGSNESSDEQPPHQVCFEEPFWLDVYEVTNEAFGSIGCESASSEPEQPRNCVSWADALAHCEARGARLPTEAEWEYAARGPDGLVYPWGNEFIDENVVYSTYVPGGIASVGSRPGGVSWIGAYDLSGNAWEWINDRYARDYYGTLSDGTINPQGPDSGIDRVIKGGVWLYFTHEVRAARRGRDNPSVEDNFIGFRCARSYTP